jgi:hypothetical protein
MKRWYVNLFYYSILHNWRITPFYIENRIGFPSYKSSTPYFANALSSFSTWEYLGLPLMLLHILYPFMSIIIGVSRLSGFPGKLLKSANSKCLISGNDAILSTINASVFILIIVVRLVGPKYFVFILCLFANTGFIPLYPTTTYPHNGSAVIKNFICCSTYSCILDLICCIITTLCVCVSATTSSLMRTILAAIIGGQRIAEVSNSAV